MVVVHQGAEVKHICVITLAVQTVQDGHEPASQAWKHEICISSHFHIIPAQPGKVLDQNQVDNAVSGILQQFQKTGPLKISPAVTVIHIGLGFYPAIEHDKLGKQFLLIFYAGGFVGGM